VATAVDEYGERGRDQGLFPVSEKQTTTGTPGIPEFISMVTGHGKLESYFHRFGITDNPMCPCEEAEDQTTDHLIFRCKKLSNQRSDMIKKTPEAIGL
jgi:hypothetical protein